jgi:hypothetical protein
LFELGLAFPQRLTGLAPSAIFGTANCEFTTPRLFALTPLTDGSLTLRPLLMLLGPRQAVPDPVLPAALRE